MTLRANVTSAAALQDIVNNLTPVVVSHAAIKGSDTSRDAGHYHHQRHLDHRCSGCRLFHNSHLFRRQCASGVGHSEWKSSAWTNAGFEHGIFFRTPTLTGSFSFSVSLTDTSVPVPTTAIRSLTITIAVPLAITTTSLNDGVISVSIARTSARVAAT